MSDATGGSAPLTTVLVGCDPQVSIQISETATGTLFIVVGPADPALPVGDIDGVFFSLSDDSTLGSLNFFPEANGGSIFSPVTGIQAAADSVDTLSNGVKVADSYDIGIQFGTVDSSTEGQVAQANFTLWSDNGPLTVADLDLDSFATVVNSDGGTGQVLTTGNAPVLVDKVALFENFNTIHDPAQSDAIVSDGGWTVHQGQLATNSCYEGELLLAKAATDGPASFTMDARTCGVQNFEATGAMADSLRLEVQIDSGDWVLLDEFVVNGHGTALVGSESGNTITDYGSTLTYTGGILDTAQDSVQFRLVSDLTATDEIILIDNVAVTTSEETTAADCEVVLSEDFSTIHEAEQSDAIASADNWDVDTYWGDLNTDGCRDGTLKLETVQSDGPAAISFDAMAGCVGNFENSGSYADSLRLEVQLGEGEWLLLDEFRVNDAGTKLVGSETGQSFGGDYTTLSYDGGALDKADGDVTFRFVSDISASNEDIYIDNIEVSACAPSEECGQYDAEYIAGIPVLPFIEPEVMPEAEIAEEVEEVLI